MVYTRKNINLVPFLIYLYLSLQATIKESSTEAYVQLSAISPCSFTNRVVVLYKHFGGKVGRGF